LNRVSDKIIEAENLVYSYSLDREEETRALDGVNLSIARGEFVVIIGRNGSGKSTLAKHFNALFLPTSGTVRINGMDTQDPRHLWRVRQTVGMVFQNPDNQIVSTTVEEDVAFGLHPRGLVESRVLPPLQ
jgi:energy-coupling factor transport system ATP-binding protein